MTLQTTDLTTPSNEVFTQPNYQVMVQQPVSRPVDQIKVTYGICIAILVIVLVIMIIVICIKANQINKCKNPAYTTQNLGLETYKKVGKKAEKYNQVASTSGIIDYKMLQKDGKITGQVMYGDNKEHIIHPFMQEYFKNMKSSK